MPTSDIPLLSMLKGRLGYLAERQKLISGNVANSDTPGYAPKDLSPFNAHLAMQTAGAGSTLALAPVPTSSAHLDPIASSKPSPWTANTTADSETRLDGNKVVLEEEMMKMNDARMNYAATISLYEKTISILQLAIRSPGKST